MTDLTKLTTEQLETLFRSGSTVEPMPLFDEIMRRLYAFESANATLTKTITDRFNRTVAVEERLMRMARGKEVLPTAEVCRELALKLGVPKNVNSEGDATQKAYEEAADLIVKMDIFIGELPGKIRAMKIPEPGPRGQEIHAIRWNQAVERSAIEIERLTEEFTGIIDNEN